MLGVNIGQTAKQVLGEDGYEAMFGVMSVCACSCMLCCLLMTHERWLSRCTLYKYRVFIFEMTWTLHERGR